MKKFVSNLRKISLYIMIFIVVILVSAAFYSNRYKFLGFNTVKYIRVNIERATNIEELAEKYSDKRSEEKFVTEVKKINNIESVDYIAGNSTIMIPIIKD